MRRDEVTEKLVKALDFMYRYFVMPGHPERAKDCPNKDCPFCKADAALAAYREKDGTMTATRTDLQAALRKACEEAATETVQVLRGAMPVSAVDGTRDIIERHL